MTELEKLNTRLHDIEDLATRAIEALAVALIDGNKNQKHLPGSWREESIETHFEHMIQHADAVRTGKIIQNDVEHMVCRAVMMYCAYLKEKYKDL